MRRVAAVLEIVFGGQLIAVLLKLCILKKAFDVTPLTLLTLYYTTYGYATI
jgi:hypothetical protein